MAWFATLIRLDTVCGGPLSKLGIVWVGAAVRLLSLWVCGSMVLASLVDDTSISTVLEKPMMLTEVACCRKGHSRVGLSTENVGRGGTHPPRALSFHLPAFRGCPWELKQHLEGLFQFPPPRRLLGHDMEGGTS